MPVHVGVAPVEHAASMEFESWLLAEINQEPLFVPPAPPPPPITIALVEAGNVAPPKPPSVEFETVKLFQP
jgi:hypothetical protein